MPVPKRKRSRARRDSRFANKGLKVKAIMTCKTCSAPILGHQACAACGHYKGIKVMKTKSERNLDRAAKREARTATRSRRNTNTAKTEQS